MEKPSMGRGNGGNGRKMGRKRQENGTTETRGTWEENQASVLAAAELAN